MVYIVFYLQCDYYTTPSIGGVYESFEQSKTRYSELTTILNSKDKYILWISQYDYGDAPLDEPYTYKTGERQQIYPFEKKSSEQ